MDSEFPIYITGSLQNLSASRGGDWGATADWLSYLVFFAVAHAFLGFRNSGLLLHVYTIFFGHPERSAATARSLWNQLWEHY